MSAGTVMPFLVAEPVPLEMTNSPAPSPMFTTIPPLAVLPPEWICAMLTVAPCGNPDAETWKLAVADITFPALFLVVLSTMVLVPVIPASALVIEGFSFFADIGTENVVAEVVDPEEAGGCWDESEGEVEL